jgi:hypothetical protein
MRKLTKEQKRDIRALAAKRDRDTMRLDSDVIAWLKSDGRGLSNQSELAPPPRQVPFHEARDLWQARSTPAPSQIQTPRGLVVFWPGLPLFQV